MYTNEKNVPRLWKHSFDMLEILCIKEISNYTLIKCFIQVSLQGVIVHCKVSSIQKKSEVYPFPFFKFSEP
jgi:hypothetical protein